MAAARTAWNIVKGTPGFVKNATVIAGVAGLALTGLNAAIAGQSVLTGLTTAFSGVADVFKGTYDAGQGLWETVSNYSVNINGPQ